MRAAAQCVFGGGQPLPGAPASLALLAPALSHTLACTTSPHYLCAMSPYHLHCFPPVLPLILLATWLLPLV